MPDEPIQGQDTPPGAPPEGKPPEGAPPKDTKPFTPEQEQYLGSWLGRIVAKQIEEKVLPDLTNTIQQHQPQFTPDQTQEVLKKFNEELQQKIFEGNVVDAFDLYSNMRARSQDILTTQQKTMTAKELTGYAEKPYYKEIYSDMKKIAEDVVRDGFAPKAAAEYAYHKAKAEHLEAKLRGDTDDSDLGFVEGGKQSQRRERLNPLPPRFKEAMDRDIQDGIIKDEAEFRKQLHPAIRKQYGI
jgi:hypothetical protein